VITMLRRYHGTAITINTLWFSSLPWLSREQYLRCDLR
jgi:hypothetical protein